MKKTFFIRSTFFVLFIAWAVFIFTMSAQPADQSTQTSSKFVLKVIDIVYRDFKNFSTQQQSYIIDIVTLLVRKVAHFAEYFVLGLLSAGIATTYIQEGHCLNYVISVFICVIYAVSDEFHQYFVPGRACRFLDICIDAAGSICAVVAVAVLVNVIKRRKTGGFYAKEKVN